MSRWTPSHLPVPRPEDRDLRARLCAEAEAAFADYPEFARPDLIRAYVAMQLATRRDQERKALNLPARIDAIARWRAA